MSESRWQVIHGDCREVLPTLGQVDALVTDPPYGIGDKPIKTKRGGKRSRGATNTWHPPSDWDAEIPEQAARLCGSLAVPIAWFGHWRKRGEFERCIGLPLRAEIVWAKDTHVGPPAPLAPRDERIWLFSPNAIKGRTFETSVWDEPIIPTWDRREHKNEKPLGLMLRLVAFFTDFDDLVLDPFCGSGTTGVACLRLGRRFIGIEKDAKHHAVAVERLQAEARGLSLRAARAGQSSIFDALGGASD